MIKRIVVFIFLTLLLIGCSSNVEENVDIKIVKNMLLKFNEHNIDITIHPQRKVVFFVDRVKVNISDQDNKYSGAVILNSNMNLHSTYVNGKNQMVRLVTAYTPEYFGKKITDKQLNKINKSGNVYEIEIQKMSDDKQITTLKFKYALKLDEEIDGISIEDNSFSFNFDNFIYPDNLDNNIPLTINVRAPKRFDISFNNKSGQVQEMEFMKKTTFTLESLPSASVLKGQG